MSAVDDVRRPVEAPDNRCGGVGISVTAGPVTAADLAQLDAISFAMATGYDLGWQHRQWEYEAEQRAIFAEAVRNVHNAATLPQRDREADRRARERWEARWVR